MGVTGLWRLIEPAGKPVPVETLENKVLAVDISIWLHQMVKGYQDAKGAPLANAHLMGLFQRLCKLLYFRIKPVFVFDGAFPDLKKETIGKRQDSRAKYQSDSERLKRELALLLTKKTAVSTLLGKQISPKKASTSNANNDDLFKLPALPAKDIESESESEDEDSSGSIIDMHSVDVESETFKNLPVKEKYNLLLDLKETRKMNSWGKIHELPKKSDNFSDFQMQRLLKRRKVQEVLQETEKEMGDLGMSLNDLESLLNEEGIDTKIETLPTRRIASDNTTRILMINNVKQALEDAKKRQEAKENQGKCDEEKQTTIQDKTTEKKDELEEDLEKAIKMSLEDPNVANTSTCTSISKTDDSWTSALTDSDYTDSEDDDGFEVSDMSSAKAYIMQYSDFTPDAIKSMIVKKNKGKGKSKFSNADKIIEELNKEKSVIVDNVELSSEDEDNDLEDINIRRNLIDADNPSSVDLNSSYEDLDSISIVDTQASVVCVGTPAQEVISLDSSTEGDTKVEEPQTELSQHPMHKEQSHSESSDEDFEEVPEPESQFKKPVVQITLKVGEDLGDDDIFADVFQDTKASVTYNKKDPGPALASDTFAVRGLDEKTDAKEIIKEEIKTADSINRVTENSENVSNALEKVIKSSQKETDLETNTVSRCPYEEMQPIVRPSTSGVKVNLASINNKLTDISEEDELQKAIQMSLECIEEDNITAPAHIEPAKPPKEPITTEQLNTMAENIQNEEQDLIQEKSRLDRIGRNITEQMTKEAQELLQIFGIPYIVAPMEAEAQCAFLESVNLTDGTITDDSDIWLFGGRTVYKNFFNQKKHVLQFLAERIERSFNLTREQLVLLALLVGSDYTTGVSGVGPVTALEILASFPFNKKQVSNETSKQARYAKIIAGLEDFKKWVKTGKRTDNTTLKKKLKNVDLNDDFPSIRVVQAYLEPNVEKSEDKFTWGEIDITILRDYARAKFGWSQNKLDEIIKPVIKRLVDRKTQRSVQDYFKRKVEFQSLEEQMSKRVKAAVQRMGPDGSIIEEEVPTEKATKPPRKRKLKASITETESTAGPSKSMKIKNDDEANVRRSQGVTVLSQLQDGKSSAEITIPKTDRYQEIIPQREKDKQGLLQNKMKAIEIFRKTKMDKKKKPIKRRANLPKDKAELSESDSD
ncbi:XPG i-region domain-containing protein [Phthorimaea operculella]|nr:XPG i-region domain-containing protein [Phthorimaea operculella]